jgi:hypothetical protein
MQKSGNFRTDLMLKNHFFPKKLMVVNKLDFFTW